MRGRCAVASVVPARGGSARPGWSTTITSSKQHLRQSSMTSPFADLVARATDENLPTENWEVNLDLCDRVSSDGESGASQALMAVTARLQQPSSKVQLYSLTLADMLGKNVPPVVIYPKLSDPALCAQLNRMVHDRANVSDEVRTRILSLIKEWDGDVSKAGHSNTLIQQTYAELKRESTYLKH